MSEWRASIVRGCRGSATHTIVMDKSVLNEYKRAAGVLAARELTDGIVVGLGRGSTAGFAIEVIADRVRGGLRMVGIPTSEVAAALARHCGMPLTDFSAHRRIDVTIAGADEVENGTLNLIKEVN